MATVTNYEDPDYLYWSNGKGSEITVVHSFYEETDTNYFEETFACEEMEEEWYSEEKMRAWMEEHGYTDDY